MKNFFLSLLAMAGMSSIPGPASAPVPKTDREKVVAVAASQIGVTEKTGKNDGEVDKYLAAVGLAGTRNPYCACFNYWCGREALGKANPYPKSAWSPDHVKGGRRVTETNEIKPGETFGIYFPSKGRIAHTGLVEKREGGNLVTIEANTSGNAASGSAADRDGQGVFRKRRPWRTVHSTRDWIKSP